MQDSDKIKTAKLANGLTLLAEEMDGVSSVAISLLVPLGAASDPVGLEGSAGILGEMFYKGAGPWDSRELSDKFEEIGAHYGHSCGVEVTVLSCVLLGEHLQDALKLFGTIVRDPRLPEDELDNVRQLALQQLRSLEDEPSHKVMVELSSDFHPFPFGRYHVGTEEGLNNISIESLRAFFRRGFVPGHAILAVAGKFSWNELLAQAEQAFGAWKGSAPLLPEADSRPKASARHLAQETNQVQIALAYKSVPVFHPDYYVAKVGVGVLSGGMSGRLFVEVREKRGLVYHVSASHNSARSRAGIFAYAGTTPVNAEETLDVLVRELRGLGQGASDEELQRGKADLKARVIMQGELSSSRAASLVNDWWNLRRVRSLDEIKAAIDSVTSEDIQRHFKEFPVENVVMVTLGPKALTLPS